jgi:hypothetical protein
MGFNRILKWLLPVLMLLFLVTGCGDLEPEMQDTRTVILNMDFHGKSSSRSSSSVSASELSQYNTHLILALPSWEYLTSNYKNFYSIFAQGLMNTADKKVSLEIPLNTQMKIFAFLFQENYSMSELFSGTREVGYYGESQSFSIGTQTNNLSLGVTLIQVPGTGTDTTDTTDTTAPTVSSISPTENQSGVSISDNIVLTFSKAMDTTSVTTNTSNTSCSGSIQVSSDSFSNCIQMSSSPSSSNSYKTFTLDPSDNLSYSTTYKIRVTTGVKDTSGNFLSFQYETSSGFTSGGLFLTWGNSGTILTSLDGTTWDNRTSGTSNHLYGVIYGKGTFVAVGASGTIITSLDGTTWDNRTSGTSNGLYEVTHGTYGNNTFVTVGPSGTILSSSDGTTWDNRTSGTSVTLWGVTYGNSTFVTVGSSGVILSSSDGTTWVNRTSGTSDFLYGVTYGNGIFVTGGYSSGNIYTSSDGTTWDNRNSGTSNGLKGYTYGNSTFVAVGDSGTILSSSDGTTWDNRTSGISNDLYGVIYGKGTFVAVGDSGTILTSSDGRTWYNRTSGTSNILWGVTY